MTALKLDVDYGTGGERDIIMTRRRGICDQV
jgi:hypothetical protein